MSKLFYSDPRIVSYMKKEFGVNCHCLYTEEEREEYDEAEESYPFEHTEAGFDTWEEVITATCRRAYVDDDSLHIFEPKRGDVCSGVDGNRVWIMNDYQKDKNGKYCFFYIGDKIIQRDNKHFFMPEVEA